ncbi:sister chromatid cohesion protein DCC1-like isoform X1 [Mytilus trossulus]|uniref:sister chromatid cohesion protein DCC1-like isoform X1 n=1 Tax=Mytilus trossulus TaxID=6551 RepID=UPI003006ED9A
MSERDPDSSYTRNEIPDTRTLQDINLVMEYAKLDKSEVKPSIQSIYFSSQMDNDAFKLMEVDSCILNTIKVGDELVIRGDKDDMAVLCTKDKTYDIKEAEISNSMLIIPQLKTGQDLDGDNLGQELNIRQVTSTKYNYYELRHCKPKVKKLRLLLEENMYSGKECEEDEEHQGGKYTYDDLLNLVQASRIELQTALKKVQACKLEGHWRILDFQFLSLVLSHVIQLCDENDWIKSGMPYEECMKTLEELFPREVLDHVLHSYADKAKPSNTEDDEDQMEIDVDFYYLNEDKVCRFFAEQILKHSRGKFNYEDFSNTWQQTVPSGMQTMDQQLQGMALIDRSSQLETITYYSVDDLPEDVAERFDELFRTKEKWSLEEISPYIRDLTTEKLDVGGLLTKYARSSMQNGVKVFNSRKPSL